MEFLVHNSEESNFWYIKNCVTVLWEKLFISSYLFMWTKLLNIYIFQKWKSQNKIDNEPHLKKKN